MDERRPHRHLKARRQPALLAAAVAACFASPAWSLPTAPTVVNGQATFQSQGNTLTVTNTPGTIINWGGFSIRADELARFQQQSSSSTVLNRVVGQDPSQILGQLQSNGRVFLLNPNGIAFGAGAQIDVAGLVASTLHLSDADFLSGKMRFREQGVAGAITNHGEIRTPAGGQVYLVAPRIENHGLVTTPGGDIILAAGKKVEIVDAANPSIRLEVVAPDNEALNVGKLVAAGGRITMGGSLLRVSGRVSADAAVVENGRIAFRRTATPVAEDVAGTVKLQAAQSLVVEAGAAITADGPVAGKVELQATGDLTLQMDSRVSASGAVGGTVDAKAATGTLVAQGTVEATGEDGPGGLIRLQGNRVALLQRSRTDASGAEGGGIVLVGGGFQGNDAATQNALRTLVLEGATIAADATREGDGGQVVVWSDEMTRFRGAIRARGAGGGRGGDVEVSGKRSLDFAGGVDVSAASGRSGTLLLDPGNINLTTSAANTTGFNVSIGDLEEAFADDGSGTSNFNVNAGGSFAGIAAGANITLQASNNISVLSAFNVATATGGNTSIHVTLQANNSIAVNAAITTAGNGSITLVADHDQNGAGAITRTAAGTLNTGAGGSVTLSAGSGLNAAVSTPTLTVSNSTSGTVTVTNANAGGGVSFGNVVASALAVTTTNGAVTQTGTVTVSGASTFTLGNAGDLTLAGAGNDFASVTVANAREVTLRDTNALAFAGASTVRGNLSVTTGGAVTQTGSMNASLGTATFNTGVADLTLGNTANNFATVAVAGAGNATLYDTGGIALGNASVTNDLTVTSTGAITDTGNVVVGGRLTVETRNNTAQAITLDSAGNQFGSVSARTLNGAGAAAVAGAITLNEASAMELGRIETTGALSVTAQGAVTQAAGANVVAGGTATFNTGAADLTLGNTTNNFGTVVVTGAGNATLYDTGGIALGNASVTNDLTVTSTGAITDTGNVVVGGRLTVETRNNTAQAITLDSAGNQFGSVSARTMNGTGATAVAGAITLREASAMEVALLTTSGGATLTANGAITQSGALTVGGTLTANAGSGNDITLDTATNNFGTVTITSARNVTLADANAVILGASTLAGNLTVTTANGAITQSGALVVPGTANFQAGTANVTLATATNNFNVLEVTAQAASVTDANALTLGRVSTSGNLTLATGAGGLNQTAGGTVTVGGTASFTAGAANNITLSNATNDFNAVRVVSGNEVALRDANAMSFGGGASVVSGNLTVTTGGALTQSSSLGVATAGRTATFNTGVADLTLGNTANDFATVVVASAANATLRDTNAIVLGNVAVTGALAVTAGGTQTQSAGSAMNVGGVATFNAGTNAITFNNAGNDFGTVVVQAGGATTLRDANAMNVGGAAIGAQALAVTTAGNLGFSGAVTAGSLSATTNGGAITQNAALTVSGTSTFNAGAGADVTLDVATNNFGTVTITSARNVTLADQNALTLGAGSFAGALNVTVGAGTLTVSGNQAGSGNGAIALTASNGGYVQNANIDVAAGAGNITITANTVNLNTNAGNNALQTSGTLTLRPSGTGAAMAIGGAPAGFNLPAATFNTFLTGLNAAGGSLTVGRADSTAAMNVASGIAFGANSTVTLAAGSFTDVGVSTLNAGTLTLQASSGNIGSSAANGAIDVAGTTNLVVTTNGQSAYLRSATGLNFGAAGSNLGSGSLVATTANGAITQSGSIVATGAATSFNSGSAALTLGHAANDFGTVQVQQSGNATIRDQNALALAGATVNGTLSITTAGHLTQTGALSVSGNATFNAGAGGNVTLANTGNNFATVLVPLANDVSLYDANGIDLGAFSVNGAITVQAVGNVSLSGVLQAAGAGNAIVLAAGGNFLNNAGASALSTTSGRWLVYSTDPASNTFGGLASGNNPLWSRTYAANGPSTIALSGNRYLFSAARNLTITGADIAKSYGDDVLGQLASAYAVAGLNTNTYGGAFLADTAAAVLSGSPSITSAGAAAGAAAAGSPYAMTLAAGTLASPTGYTLAYGAAGQLTVNKAALTIGVQDAFKLQGEVNPPFLPTYSGFRNGEGTPALAGALLLSTAAGPNSPAGSYAITPSGFTAANYTITYAPGTLRVLKPIAGDPLADSYRSLRGPGEAGQLDFRGAGPISQPSFVIAEANLPFEDLLKLLPPTASGPGTGGRRVRVLDPACGAGQPHSALRCRSVDDE